MKLDLCAATRLLVVLALFAQAGLTQATDGTAPSIPDLARLGRVLFFDPGLSASGKLACSNCHDPKFAYGPPPGKAIALGGVDMHQSGTRAVPSIRYLRGNPPFEERHKFNDGDAGPIGGFTWDGRARSIREQASLPLLAPNEMANHTPAEFAARLRRSAVASELRRVFGVEVFSDPQRTLAAVALALEAFQQTPDQFFPYSSRYDAFLRGELDLNEQEARGVALFKNPSKGNCASCHLITARGGTPPAFTDFDLVNVGVPRNPRIPANADPDYYDLGMCGPRRTDYLGDKRYCGFFRAPSLRNTAIRDAYFHNGVFKSLEDVLRFYVERDLQPEKYYPRSPDGSVRKFDDLPPGYANNIDRDPPLDRDPGAEPALTDAEMDDIIAFLKTLSDSDAAR